MTFIRNIQSGKNTYRYEVRTYRENGKVKQKTRYIGKVIIKNKKEELISPRRSFVVETPTQVRSYGLLSILYQVAQEWDIVNTINKNNASWRSDNHHGEAILLLALNHIVGRQALDRISEWYKRSVIYPRLGTEDLFTKKKLLEAMDSMVYEDEYGDLHDYTIPITKILSKKYTELLGRSDSGLIYDITEVTSYSENNPYADLGYSAINENNKLVKVCLITRRDSGIPVTIFINNGCINDKSTIKEMIGRLELASIKNKNSYILQDRGMVSEENLQLEIDAGFNVISGLTLRRKEVEGLITQIEESELLSPKNAIKHGNGFAYVLGGEFSLGKVGGKAIACLVPDLQNNVRTARTQALQDATRELDERNKKRWNKTPPKKISDIAKGIIESVKRFIELEIDEKRKIVRYHFREAEITKQLRLDGRFAIFSSDKTISDKDIFTAYFSRDVVEKAFRLNKQELELPPLRHWKHRRIISYLQICFIAYLFQSYLMRKAKCAKIEMGWTDLKFSLMDIHQIVYKSSKTVFINVTPEQKQVITKLGYLLV